MEAPSHFGAAPEPSEPSSPHPEFLELRGDAVAYVGLGHGHENLLKSVSLSRRGPWRAPPGAETCTSHSKVQFQPSFSSAKCTSREQNAHLDEEEAGRGPRGPRRPPRPHHHTPARAIMIILTHEPPFPARKAQCIASQSVCGMVPPFSVARIRSAR